MAAVWEDELLECDGERMGGCEVFIQCMQRPGAARNRRNRHDASGSHSANGNDEMIKNIDRLHDAPGDALPSLFDPHLLIQGDLQWGAAGDGHREDVGVRRWLRRRGLRRRRSALRRQPPREGPDDEKEGEGTCLVPAHDAPRK